MHLLHLMAKTYSRRPSEIVGVADEWAAYQLDVAVLLGSVDDETGGGDPDGGPVDESAEGWLALV